MDFAPGEASLALQRLARDFARQEIAPHTDALDQEKNPENRFPGEILDKGDSLGLRTLPVPGKPRRGRRRFIEPVLRG